VDTPTISFHDSFRDPHAELWFGEPAGYTALPVEALLPTPDSPDADKLRASVAPFLDSLPDEMVRQQFIAQFASGQRLLATLWDIGTVHCSIGLHCDDVEDRGDDIGTPLLSLFTISWRDTKIAPRGVTAARAVTATGKHAHIEFLELPCGPAAFSETMLTASADSGLPQQPLLQIHAHLPHPDCKRLAVLSVSTTAMSRREEYREILRQIAGTVSFANPLEAGTKEDRR
jgi:hypothetical protein